MTLLVPYDGSDLATAALETASEYGSVLAEPVIALTVIPDDAGYARDRGWITRGEPFDTEAVATGLEERIGATAPDASVRIEPVTVEEPTATPTTRVVREIRRVAVDVDASVVFLGSENAGSVTAPLSSVGGPVASDHEYDLYLVRHTN
jgi:nucleotide-binding universal stress UspA family protein